MKKLILLATLGMVLIGGIAGANEGLVYPTRELVKTANFTGFAADPNQIGGTVTGGSITIDLKAQEVTLLVSRRFKCPVGRYCAMSMPVESTTEMVIAPFTLKLPLKSVNYDGCGNLVYTASQDLRTVDGTLQEITVTDSVHRSSTGPRCMYFVAPPATSVEFDTVGGRPVNDKVADFHSRFEGGELVTAEQVSDQE